MIEKQTFNTNGEIISRNEPQHYSENGLSPIGAFKQGLISKEEYIGFIKGNIIKYIVRCDKKGESISDINKAIHYCEMLKEQFE